MQRMIKTVFFVIDIFKSTRAYRIKHHQVKPGKSLKRLYTMLVPILSKIKLVSTYFI
jgi:hypothetical protein